MRDKLYFMYKTTNLKNNKFYIGVHETNNLEDGYLGSGKRFKNSLYYHGKENFKREILEYFDDSKSMYNREREIVNEELLKNPKCMNLKVGGTGGFSHISAAQRIRNGRIGGLNFAKKLQTDSDLLKTHILRASQQFKEYNKTSKKDNFKGKTHSEETKKKMRDSHKGRHIGKNNSQFGSKWITNGTENKKINKSEKIPSGFEYGRKIKALKSAHWRNGGNRPPSSVIE